MSQVIIEMGRAPMPEVDGAQVFAARGHVVEEITSSGTSQTTTISAPANGSVAVVLNIGSEVIWVNFDGTASVGEGHVVPANQTREFGPLSSGDQISIINDS